MEMSISANRAGGHAAGGTTAAVPGILASSLAPQSVRAAGIAISGPAQKAVWALLLGGMLIHPVGLLICKLLGARGAHTSGNPLGQLAGSSTFWLDLLPAARLWAEPRRAALVLSGHAADHRRPLPVLRDAVRHAGCTGCSDWLSLLRASRWVISRRLYWMGASTGAAIEAVCAILCLVQHRRRLPDGNESAR